MTRRTEHITVRVPPETRRQLEQLAAQEHRTLSNLVRVLLLEALANRTTVVGPVRRSYAFANWLHGYNAQHSTDYRPTTVPDSVVEQYNANRTATPPAGSGVGEE